MKKILFWVLAAVLMLLAVSACSSGEPKEVRMYEMESFAVTKEDSLIVITDSKDIEIFERAVDSATERLGIANMADPDYKFDLGGESYFLWIDMSAESGTLMNIENTHTTYSLADKSVKEVNEILRQHFQ